MNARSAHISNGSGNIRTRGADDRAAVLLPVMAGVRDSARNVEARLDEACGLASAIGLSVAHRGAVRVQRPRAATLIGTGAIDALKPIIAEQGIAIVIVDAELSPVQQRNLELAWKVKVIDRTGLILEIFGERAQTAEGRLQVELAALTYQRSRLVRSWTHLERQRGGFGFMGGPGETQIEADRRQIDTRIAHIKADLGDVRRTRGLHRRARRRRDTPVVALVGYTNAGKSTLFNRLTGAGVVVRDLLFATLDPTMREIGLPSGRRVVLSDTVGFVSHLPTDLVEAFRATLEEVENADVIVHVRDIAHPDSEAQKADVEAVLGDLGIDAGADPRMIEARNKIDLLGEDARNALAARTGRESGAVALSAATGEGIGELLEALDSRLSAGRRIYEYCLGPEEGAAIAWLYDHGEVMERADRADGRAEFKVELDPRDAARFENRREEAEQRSH